MSPTPHFAKKSLDLIENKGLRHQKMLENDKDDGSLLNIRGVCSLGQVEMTVDVEGGELQRS